MYPLRTSDDVKEARAGGGDSGGVGGGDGGGLGGRNGGGGLGGEGGGNGGGGLGGEGGGGDGVRKHELAGPSTALVHVYLARNAIA